MKKFIDEYPTPPQPHDEDAAIPLKLVQTEMNKLDELKAIRAQYISSMPIDRKFLKVIDTICRENADLAESLY